MIRWTLEERRAVVENAARRMQREPAWTLLDAVRMAQTEVLPPERRRNLLMTQMVESLREDIENWRPTEDEKPEVSVEQRLLDAMRDYVRVHIVDIIKQEIRDMLVTVLQDTRTELTVPERLQTPPVRVAKPRILVVGAKPSQERTLERRFPEVEFRFWKDGNYTRLKDLSQSVDKVYILTKFISHAHQSAIFQVRTDAVRIPGMISNLTRILTRDLGGET